MGQFSLNSLVRRGHKYILRQKILIFLMRRQSLKKKLKYYKRASKFAREIKPSWASGNLLW